jgi:hypothetical protein
MPNYIIAYLGGKPPKTPEQGKTQMEKWKKWLADLGEAAVNPGSPMGSSKFVSSNGVSDDDGPEPMSGFSIVKAGDMESALEIAGACPFLDTGGRLRVAELKEMQM